MTELALIFVLFVVWLCLVVFFCWIFNSIKSMEKKEPLDFWVKPYVNKLVQPRYEIVSKNRIKINGLYLNFVTCYHYTHPEKNIMPGDFNIVLDGEPMDISYLEADLILTSKKEKIPLNIATIYVPYYAIHLNQIGISPRNLIKKDSRIEPKEKFCFFAYSNCDENFRGVKDRRIFYELLQEKSGGRVDNLGTCLNPNPPINQDKNLNHFLTNYKFSIAFENERLEGFITEKLISPMLAGTIPIYFGPPDVGEHFNTKSFINVNDFDSFKECIDWILKVDEDDELYQQILREPWLHNNKLNDNFSFNMGGRFWEEIQQKVPIKYQEIFN